MKKPKKDIKIKGFSQKLQPFFLYGGAFLSRSSVLRDSCPIRVYWHRFPYKTPDFPTYKSIESIHLFSYLTNIWVYEQVTYGLCSKSFSFFWNFFGCLMLIFRLYKWLEFQFVLLVFMMYTKQGEEIMQQA